MKIRKHGTGILLAALLLPATASALLCERNGTCADSQLNQAYEIKKEIRQQGQETRRVIREERRTESYLQDQGKQQRIQHRARDVLLHPKKKPLSR